MPEKSSRRNERKRMSFLFPKEFYELLKRLSEKYNKDMSYIIIEAVNSHVMTKENIVFKPDGIFMNGEEVEVDLLEV